MQGIQGGTRISTRRERLGAREGRSGAGWRGTAIWYFVLYYGLPICRRFSSHSSLPCITEGLERLRQLASEGTRDEGGHEDDRKGEEG
jgi:hypothetical protein